ncbi:MAG: diguanylate cyclase (GGDEF)-like protein [Flavobacteriaceae bacterium]
MDTLTGIPNRNMCVDRLTHAIAKARRSGAPVSVLIVGLDHFKEVNDTMGHLAGDLLLCSASDRLQTLLRDSDTLARLGSDEFVVIIDDEQNIDAVPIVTQKIIDSFKKPFDISECEVLIGASIGISIFPQDD